MPPSGQSGRLRSTPKRGRISISACSYLDRTIDKNRTSGQRPSRRRRLKLSHLLLVNRWRLQPPLPTPRKSRCGLQGPSILNVAQAGLNIFQSGFLKYFTSDGDYILYRIDLQGDLGTAYSHLGTQLQMIDWAHWLISLAELPLIIEALQLCGPRIPRDV